jgi:subtilisin family serine protease
MPVPDVVDQIIVGFNSKTLGKFAHNDAVQRINDALGHLERHFGATVLDRLVTPDEAPFFAIAIITLRGTTLHELRETIDKSAMLSDIGWVERNALIAPATYNDPLLAQQWALSKLGATAPWTVNPPAGNGKTIVAIVDSGLRRPDGNVHADLGYVEAANVCQPPTFFPDCLDDDGHGTLLAGTIAAKPGNNVGISSATEPTWNISLLPVKFFSPAWPPNAAYAAHAIVHAANALSQPGQRKVINASWHVSPGDSGLITLRNALDLAVNTQGCLVVFAAGNDGTDNEIFPLYPANFGSTYGPVTGKTLTVIATDRYDAKASFSNYGKTFADLGAPGLHILSTGRYLVDPPRYASYSGTSAAAAFVSAGAALVFALHPQNWDNAGAAAWTAADVRQHLLASANTIEDLKLACAGGKRLNLRRAVYGPLRITAPVQGNTLHVGVLTNITWMNTYTNPVFTRVKIEFSKDNGATYPAPPIAASTLNNGAFNWTPTAGQATPQGRIRITPTTGNFPKVSGRFSVI